jgi:hypothetical protein
MYKVAIMMVVLAVGVALEEPLLFPVTDLVTAQELCESVCSCGYSVTVYPPSFLLGVKQAK